MYAGALSFEDGFRLMQEMALLQEELSEGGQIIYPLVDDAWQPHEEARAAVDAAFEGRDDVFPSIHLGGFTVLAGSDDGIRHLMRALPPMQLGKNRYPFKLIGHGPYHTPLAESVSARAREQLSGLQWKRPNVTLIDGRGARFTPWSTDLDALRDYTLGDQVTKPYDFTLSVRVLLREQAPDELVLPGPGNTLGSISGQILCAEGWRHVHTRDDFDALQGSDRAVVRSMRR